MPLLHVRCGEDIGESLADAGLGGRLVVWADPVCEGPLRPWAADGDRWRDRAIHLSTRYFLSYGELLRNLGFQDARLDDGSVGADETVLWFEHDLFDQLILVFLLRRLSTSVEAGRVSLVSIDRHPSVDRFIGLGQLGPDHLAELHGRRVRVTADQVAAASKVWTALVSPSPEGLGAIAATAISELPFLAAALRRYLAEFPSTENGLSRTERYGLETIAGGLLTAREAFPAVQTRESAPFQGDSMFFATLRGLARGERPLLARRDETGPPLDKLRDDRFATTPVAVTRAGEAVLAGRDDWYRAFGASSWIGGTHLIGPEPRWRWDERSERLIEAS